MLHKTNFDTCHLQEINLETVSAAAHIASLDTTLTMEANCYDKDEDQSSQMAIRKEIRRKATGNASITSSKTPYTTKNILLKQNMSATVSSFKGERLYTLGLYCPTTGRDEDFETYLNAAEGIIDEQRKNHSNTHIVICGDFNVNTKNLSKHRKKRYEAFKSKLNLSEHKPDTHTFFPKDKRARSSTLDWILTSEKVTVKGIRTITLDEVTHTADHMPVYYSIEIPITHPSPDTPDLDSG